MAPRARLTAAHIRAYAKASKKDKGLILDQVVQVSGWTRDYARRKLSQAVKQATMSGRWSGESENRRNVHPKRASTRRYSQDALEALQLVWSISGELCGKYLAASMAEWLDSMERAGGLIPCRNGYSPEVREELLQMSAATIDRYLAPARQSDRSAVPESVPGPLLRNLISTRNAADEGGEVEPGSFKMTSVAHCGPVTSVGFVRSMNFADLATGWVHTVSLPDATTGSVETAFESLIRCVPYMVLEINCDRGWRFTDHDLVGWSERWGVAVTGVEPSAEEHDPEPRVHSDRFIRRYGLYYRYDSPAELSLLNRLWPLVNDRLNYFTPTKKPVGHTSDSHGRRKRVYDAPKTPYQRLLDCQVLSRAQQAELASYKKALDPIAIAAGIESIGTQLVELATEKTRRLEGSGGVRTRKGGWGWASHDRSHEPFLAANPG